MNNILNYIKQKEKVFVIISAVIQFLIFFFSGISFFFIFQVYSDNRCWDFNYNIYKMIFHGIVLILCSFVFPFKMIMDTFHINIKFLWINKIVLGLALLISFFVGEPIYYVSLGQWIIVASIVFIVSSCAEIVCLELKQIRNPIMAIALHAFTMAPIVFILTCILNSFVFDSSLSYILFPPVIIGVLEMVFYAFVYAGVSRWGCPDCHRINKGKAKFCVGCGKVRPVEPKPVRKPRPAPVYAAPAPQPITAAPQPITAAPQPSAAEPQPEGTSFCSECGAPLEPGSVFCGQCGKPLK